MVAIASGLELDVGPDRMCARGTELGCDSSGAPLPIWFPKVKVELAPFELDVDEVTNAQYRGCVDANACTAPHPAVAADGVLAGWFADPSRGGYPVVNVDWGQADAYCRWVGKRLPTSVEWERAARGPRGDRALPAGSELRSVADCVGALAVVGCGSDAGPEPAGPSPTSDWVADGEGRIEHLAANVAEWTDTWFRVDVTCAADPPCTRIDLCPPGDMVCEVEAVDCDACDAGARCAYQCEGSATQALVCVPYDGPVTALALLPTTGVAKEVRGGSFALEATGLCRLYGWAREARPPAEHASDLGFRCARSL